MKRPLLFPDIPRPLVFAHRGCSYRAPENTLPAFRLARDQGIRGIELDIQLSADGELMVFHDQTLDRICGTPASLRSLTRRELQRLDAGVWKSPGYAGTRIPALDEVLEEFGGTMLFDIEIKYYRPEDAREIIPLLKHLLDGLGLNRSICVSSFDPRIVRRAKMGLPGIPAGLIYDSRSLPVFLPLQAALRFSRSDFLKPDCTIFTGRRPGNRTAVCWTVDDPGKAEDCLQQGAEGVISNRPEDLFTESQ